jgi:hypothetical protein
MLYHLFFVNCDYFLVNDAQRFSRIVAFDLSPEIYDQP